MELPPGVGLPGLVWVRKQATWLPDVLAEANFPRAAMAARYGLHAAFGCPILLEGEVLGVMEFFSREIRPPEPDLPV